MERRTRTHRSALVLLLAGGMLVTGCGAGGTSDESKADRSSSGGPRGGQPAPSGPPSAAPEQQEDGAQRKDNGDDREAAPPDYLSTFALDVDTASYGYARRLLGDGRLPAPETVRPEEFVNSFRQGYERPEGNGFSVTVDGTRAGAGDWSLVRVGLATGTADDTGERPPAALTFVVDISGSMGSPAASTSRRSRWASSPTNCATTTPSPSSRSAGRPRPG